MTSILVVCTGNICRSPIAEGFLRDAFSARFGDGAAPVVSSAGIAGLEGYPASEGSIISAADYGSDISGHRARMLTRPMLDADLVVGMASEHRDDVIEMAPDLAGRAFTLKELVRLLEGLDPISPSDESVLAQRVADADTLRRSGFPENDQDESVVDPIGLPLSTYRAVASELDEWTRRLVVGLFGTHDVMIDDDRMRGAMG